MDQTQQKTECSYIPTVTNKFTAKDYLLRNRVLQRAFERLDAKVSRAVLRGRDGGDTILLPDTLATGVSDQGRIYHIGGFKGSKWYNRQLDKIRSKRDKCPKGSGRYRRLSHVYQRVSQQKRNKQQDCLHKASHLIAHALVERTVVIGDLSQRQMVMKARQERNKYLNRAVYNEWGLYGFVEMLCYKCVLYGKELIVLDERDTSKTCSGCEYKQNMPLWQRTYRCKNPDCRLVMDRDENSAVNILKRYFARLGPHTDDSVRCADVFTAIEQGFKSLEPLDVLDTCEHI